MAGTVPALLGRIPVHVAAEMRADCRNRCEAYRLSPRLTATFCSAVANDAAFARLQLVRRLPISAGIRYSAKFLIAVTFSLMKFIAPETGLREGS